MNQTVRTKLAAAAALAVAVLAPAAQADGAQSDGGWGGLNMPVGVTELSKQIYDLHMLILWVCIAIAVVVFGVMAYSIVSFRKSQGAIPDTTMVHSTKAEIIWTVIPVFILVAMAVPATRTLIAIEDTRNTEISIKVTGYQWKWGYKYLNDDFSFYSTLSTPREQIEGTANKDANYLLEVDEPMVVPVGKRVRLLVTANDVIHSWWVPALGAKQDAIPGFIRDIWFKADKIGTYRGQCVELCGKDHGFMPIVVEVVSEADYKAWVAKKRGAATIAAADENKPLNNAEPVAATAVPAAQ